MTEKVGTRIAKRFGQKVHFGTIKKIWKDDDDDDDDESSKTQATSRWHIEYDDGDEEDFDKDEVRIAVKLWNKHKKDDKKSKISKKRKIDGIVRDLDDDFTTKTSGNDNNNKLKRGKQEELQKKKKTNTKSKKDSVISKSKAPPTKSSDKTGDSKNAVIKVESESNDEITTMTTTTPATEKLNILDSFDVILPLSIVNSADNSNGGGDQCTLLVEVSDPNDAIALGEFGGSVGAIGRFESDPNGITLDLKGNQYRGSLLPGPTCLVVGFPSHKFGSSKKEQQEPIGKLRVEGIADEYTTLVQIDDHMKKLDAVVTGNNNNNEEVDSD
ncbi:hypothetical protein FRACYDRAFT_242211 [Fragilariopsis cylindrus CCMP1102]|uniref:Uncharacterized protein n=1 Tax=Fragilariopsis cylindrus CCMP1102 TaxID=635003 RepID=A0A1E7F6T7_9STRA|nr:hypothetical protein FRACYDRAFT_242211 [Fragilariopsis cylindrus CCMP1102]|eukprot:OEU13860.1 hypothetical protein FRACYDRAFT_242211 [Fragilariopsis cylindrus CCMP1102]